MIRQDDLLNIPSKLSGFLYHPLADIGGYYDIPNGERTNEPRVDFLVTNKDGYVKTVLDVDYALNGNYYPKIAKKNGWSNGKTVLSGDNFNVFKSGKPFLNVRTTLAFVFSGFYIVVQEYTTNNVFVYSGKTLVQSFQIGNGTILRASANSTGSKLIIKAQYGAAPPFTLDHAYSASVGSWEAFEEYTLSLDVNNNVVLTLDTRTEQFPHLVYEVDYQFNRSSTVPETTTAAVFNAILKVKNNVSAIREMYYDDDDVKQTHTRSAYTITFTSSLDFEKIYNSGLGRFEITKNNYDCEVLVSFSETLANSETGEYSFHATKSWAQHDGDYLDYYGNTKFGLITTAFIETFTINNQSTSYDKTGKIAIYDNFSKTFNAALSGVVHDPLYSYDKIDGTETKSLTISDNKSDALELSLTFDEINAGTGGNLTTRYLQRDTPGSNNQLSHPLGQDAAFFAPTTGGGDYLTTGSFFTRAYNANDNSDTSWNQLFVGVSYDGVYGQSGYYAEPQFSYIYTGQLFDNFLYDKYNNILYQYHEPRGFNGTNFQFDDHFKLFKKNFAAATQPPAQPPFVACDEINVLGAI